MSAVSLDSLEFVIMEIEWCGFPAILTMSAHNEER